MEMHVARPLCQKLTKWKDYNFGGIVSGIETSHNRLQKWHGPDQKIKLLGCANYIILQGDCNQRLQAILVCPDDVFEIHLNGLHLKNISILITSSFAIHSRV